MTTNSVALATRRGKRKSSLSLVNPEIVKVNFPAPSKIANSPYKLVRVGPEFITAEIAAEWLKLNLKNRYISRGSVNAYADDLEAGDWDLSSDCICFDTNGNLMNGQHRLQACVDTGIGFWCLVAYNMPISAYRVIDFGRKRKLSDLEIMKGSKQPTLVPPAAKWLLKIKLGKGVQGGKRKQSHMRISHIIESHPGLETSASRVWNSFGLKPSLLATFHYIGNELLGEQTIAEDFVTVFVRGDSFYKNDAAKAWRERLIRMKESATQLKDTELIWGTTLAWNMFRNQQPVLEKHFQIPTELIEVEGLDLDRI